MVVMVGAIAAAFYKDNTGLYTNTRMISLLFIYIKITFA